MSKIKVAVIGTGNIAQCHLDGYMRCNDAEVYAICDINEERLNRTGDKYGISRRYTDVDTLLKECADELDAADVCVWNCNHASCAIKALEAGLHVLCEKPMAYNTEEAIKMKEAADKNGKLLMIGFVMRFMDNTKIAKDFVDSGILGDIYYSKMQYIRRHGNPGGWFSDKSKSGGGPVIDLGVHVIDFARYLMGSPKPVSVYASVESRLGSRNYIKTGVEWTPDDSSDADLNSVEDFGVALIRYDNGAVTLLETTYDINGEDSAKKQLFGTKGGLDVTDKPKIFTECNGFLVDMIPKTEGYKYSGGYHFNTEIAHFVDCVKNGTKCIATADDGITVMKILDAIYESGRTGHEVIIK